MWNLLKLKIILLKQNSQLLITLAILRWQKKTFDKILKENNANFIKLVQEGGLDNTRTAFYINFDKISCFINYEKYKVAVKFKKNSNDGREDSIYIDSKLSNSEFEMLKLQIAKNKNFINA